MLPPTGLCTLARGQAYAFFWVLDKGCTRKPTNYVLNASLITSVRYSFYRCADLVRESALDATELASSAQLTEPSFVRCFSFISLLKWNKWVIDMYLDVHFFSCAELHCVSVLDKKTNQKADQRELSEAKLSPLMLLAHWPAHPRERPSLHTFYPVTWKTSPCTSSNLLIYPFTHSFLHPLSLYSLLNTHYYILTTHSPNLSFTSSIHQSFNLSIQETVYKNQW